MVTGADALVALAVLVLNDRVLKGRAPGWLTGKLSDVAGLYLFPLVLAALVEVGAKVLRRCPPSRAVTVGIAASATALVFAAIKVVPVAGDGYQTVFGWLRWPLSATESWLAGDGFGAPANVHLTRDATDVLAVPMAAVAWWVHRHDAGHAGPARRSRAARHPRRGLRRSSCRWTSPASSRSRRRACSGSAT